MLKYKLFTVYVFVKGFFFPCHQDRKIHDFENARKEFKIDKVGKLPEHISESSGLITLSENAFATVNDGGNPSVIYHINTSGEVLDSFSVESNNYDWETLSDDDSLVYICDVGNNLNNRKNLTVYAYQKASEYKLKYSLHFTYPDQHDFPPSPDKLNFDCEGSVAYKDSLYFFSKNRGNGLMHLYAVPTQAGNFVATLSDSLALKGSITGAAIRPDRKELALLSYGYVYFFELSDNGFFEHPTSCAYYGRLGQSEAITYINNRDLLLTNEQRKVFLLKRK